MESHIGTDWRDQWERVQRWHNRVRAIGSGAPTAGVLPHPDADGAGGYTAWALDLIFAFFMNCDHLSDWLTASDPSLESAVDAHVKRNDSLAWCRDICNGMKHFRLDPARKPRYQNWTTATEAAVYLNGERVARAEPIEGLHWVFVDPETGERRDMFELVDACVRDWAAFLRATSST